MPSKFPVVLELQAQKELALATREERQVLEELIDQLASGDGGFSHGLTTTVAFVVTYRREPGALIITAIRRR